MKRTLKDRVTGFFIYMGRKNKLLRIPAIIGLAISFWIFRIADYFRKGTKRFACVAFILLCFMIGNSFAYPVFQEKGGFVENAAKEETPAVSEDTSLTLTGEIPLNAENIPILMDEDILEGFEEAELQGMEEAEKFSLSEILGEDVVIEEQEGEPELPAGDELSTEFDKTDWKLVLINKQHPIPSDYDVSLGNIKTIKGIMKCDERITEELLSMMQAARRDGVTLEICSPYRDLNYQTYLFNKKIKAYMKMGMSYMDAYMISSQAVTVPGYSEHQIGLAIDIVSDNYQDLNEGFADTDAGKWLAEHSCEYGFTLRYPKGKELITGIEFEPWHFRYVGKDASMIMAKEGLTLEEFWDKYL